MAKHTILVCQACGFDYLHQGTTQVYFPFDDAANEGIHATISAMGLNLNTSMKGNPSGRRSGIRILFDCEGCNAITELTIVQHNGRTFLEQNIAKNRHA